MALTFQIYAMTLRLSAMVEEKMKEIINGWNSAVKQRKNSPRQAAQSSYINSIASRYKFLVFHPLLRDVSSYIQSNKGQRSMGVECHGQIIFYRVL